MGIFINKSDILQEVYLGKYRQFETIEKELAKIINIIKEDSKDLYKLTKAKTVIDDTDSNRIIENLFREIFKLKSITIHWTDSMINAYTITGCPIMFIETKKNLKATKTYFNEKLKIYIFIDTSLVRLCNMNEKELLAIILHEIGHNLDISPFYLLSILPVIWLVPIINPLIRLFSELRIDFENMAKENFPLIYNFLSVIQDFMNQLSGPLTSKVNPIKLVKEIPQMYEKIITNVFKYGQERFSDSFAATYGYGEHLASALYKIENADTLYQRVVVKTPVLNVISDFWNVILGALISFIDPHPNIQARIVNMRNKLERDLKDPSLPQDLKKDLLSNIEAIDNYYKEFIENSDTKKNKVFTYMVQKFADKLFKGKLDIRELALNKMYEKNEA